MINGRDCHMAFCTFLGSVANAKNGTLIVSFFPSACLLVRMSQLLFAEIIRNMLLKVGKKMDFVKRINIFEQN